MKNGLLKKLQRVETMQLKIQEILQELENKFPALAESDDEHRSFSMHVDANGSIKSAVETYQIAETFLVRGESEGGK